MPLPVWPVGERGWRGIGLGDLRLAAVGLLVFRMAGWSWAVPEER